MALPPNYRTPAVPPALFGRRQSVSAAPSSHHKSQISQQSYNPFHQGQPGHPAFAAARFARLAETQQDAGNKPVKAPKPPLMPYMRYSKKMWDHVKAANPRIKSIPDIGKMIGKMWQDLTDEERKEYEVEYELEKVAYQEQMQNYHNSSAYQDWFKKEEVRKLQLAQEAEEKKHISSRVGVVQADEDEDNVFSLKHLAAARYSRNHLLMAEVFSDTVVPDMRQAAVFGKKVASLRGQRETLETTLASRHNDVKAAEESHDKIARKIVEDRERWDSVWADACAKKPKLTDDMFEQLVNRSRLELREKMRQQQQQMLEQQQQKESNNSSSKADVHNESVSDAAGLAEPVRVEAVAVDHQQHLVPDQQQPLPQIESAAVADKMECLVEPNNQQQQPVVSVIDQSTPALTATAVGSGDGPQLITSHSQSQSEAEETNDEMDDEEVDEDEEDADEEDDEAVMEERAVQESIDESTAASSASEQLAQQPAQTSTTAPALAVQAQERSSPSTEDTQTTTTTTAQDSTTEESNKE